MPGIEIVIAVLFLFPLFGAAVFFWWRKQYGVWSKRGGGLRDGRAAQVVDDDAFNRGAAMGMMSQAMFNHQHSRDANPANGEASDNGTPTGVDAGLYHAGGSSHDGGSAFSSDSGGAGGGSFDSGGGGSDGGGGGGGGGE